MASIGGDSLQNNSLGFGFKIAGSAYYIDVILVNCPQVGFYSEAVDYTDYGLEHASIIKLRGRIFGKEGVIFRGPADIEIGPIFIGAVSWLPTLKERQTKIVYSDVYPGEVVNVMVADEDAPYHGHHEFNMMHLYGNLSGWGYFCRNMGRLKGNHMVCENCRGGSSFSSRTWGKISILECHNNGRKPKDYTGELEIFPDIRNPSRQSFDINATIRRVKTESEKYLGYDSINLDGENTGRNGRVVIDYFSLNDPETEKAPVGDVAHIPGTELFFSINARDVVGDVVRMESISSDINVIATDVEGNVVYRVAGDTSGFNSNNISITARNVSNCIYLDGLVTPESIKICANLNNGQTIYLGDEPDLVTRGANWNVVARVNNKVQTSNRRGRDQLNAETTDEQTIVIPHKFFIVPDPALVKLSIYDPIDQSTTRLDFIKLTGTDRENITIKYRFENSGSGFPKSVLWSIN